MGKRWGGVALYNNGSTYFRVIAKSEDSDLQCLWANVLAQDCRNTKPLIATYPHSWGGGYTVHWCVVVCRHSPCLLPCCTSTLLTAIPPTWVGTPPHPLQWSLPQLLHHLGIQVQFPSTAIHACLGDPPHHYTAWAWSPSCMQPCCLPSPALALDLPFALCAGTLPCFLKQRQEAKARRGRIDAGTQATITVRKIGRVSAGWEPGDTTWPLVGQICPSRGRTRWDLSWFLQTTKLHEWTR